MKYILLLIAIPCICIGQQRVLHYDETEGFNHGTRAVSLAFFQSLESTLNVAVVGDSNGSEFTMEKLANYDVVIFSNTSGIDLLSEEQKAALEWFIDVKGGGLIGIHAATDTYRHSTANGSKRGEWDWYAETMGGSVQNSPNHTSRTHVNTITEITATPATSGLTFPWEKQEEYYYWENGYLNSDIQEILRVGDTGGNSYDDPRPVAWQRTNSAGSRIFYTSLGHDTENFSGPGFPQFRQLLEDATAWALQANSTVPVEFVRFNASYDIRRKATALSWSTASEINASYFEVQKSVNGIIWKPIGRVQAEGNSSELIDYAFTDRESLAGLQFYRLKQVDENGSYIYSNIQKVLVSKNSDIRLSPIPVESLLTVSFSDTDSGNLRVVNLDGRQVLNRDFMNVEELHIDLNSQTSGIYYLIIESEKASEVMKFVKI